MKTTRRSSHETTETRTPRSPLVKLRCSVGSLVSLKCQSQVLGPCPCLLQCCRTDDHRVLRSIVAVHFAPFLQSHDAQWVIWCCETPVVSFWAHARSCCNLAAQMIIACFVLHLPFITLFSCKVTSLSGCLGAKSRCSVGAWLLCNGSRKFGVNVRACCNLAAQLIIACCFLQCVHYALFL